MKQLMVTITAIESNEPSWWNWLFPISKTIESDILNLKVSRELRLELIDAVIKVAAPSSSN